MKALIWYSLMNIILNWLKISYLIRNSSLDLSTTFALPCLVYTWSCTTLFQWISLWYSSIDEDGLNTFGHALLSIWNHVIIKLL